MENWLGIKTKSNTLVFNNFHFVELVQSVLKNKNEIKFISYNLGETATKCKISTNFKSKKYKNNIVKLGMQNYFLFRRNSKYYICSNRTVLKKDDDLISSNNDKIIKTIKSKNNAFWILKTLESGRYFILSTCQYNTPLRLDLQEVENMAEKMAIFDDLLFGFNSLNKADKAEFLQKIVKFEVVQTIL